MSYLRAAGARATRSAAPAIRGVPATAYHVIVDLRRYAQHRPPTPARPPPGGSPRSPAGDRSSAMPFDVWIDGANRVRRVHFACHRVCV